MKRTPILTIWALFSIILTTKNKVVKYVIWNVIV